MAAFSFGRISQMGRNPQRGTTSVDVREARIPTIDANYPTTYLNGGYNMYETQEAIYLLNHMSVLIPYFLVLDDDR